MTKIVDRSLKAISLEDFNDYNYPEFVCDLDLELPDEEVKVLRILIKDGFSDFKIPENLMWTMPMVQKAYEYQTKKIKVKHSFCYLTIRKGIVNYEQDDEWHTDGFSQSITHIPEQNYIWTNNHPTEFYVKPIKFPKDFDTMKHNVHRYIQDQILENFEICRTCDYFAGQVFCIDPFVIHRRPKVTNNTDRAFVRVSFTPIEIADCNNTFNPELPRKYERDGRKWRENLERYQN